MARHRATAEEWRHYYERAARRRAAVGDPFKQHLRRVSTRERVMLGGAALFMLVVIAAFVLLAGQS
jgi:type II secretory pathway component PulM